MTTLITWLTGEPGGWIAGALAALVTLAGVYLRGRASGTTAQKLRDKEKDVEKAERLRRTVDRGLDQRMREMDGRGYRD